jgi:hypothetical protein
VVRVAVGDGLVREELADDADDRQGGAEELLLVAQACRAVAGEPREAEELVEDPPI